MSDPDGKSQISMDEQRVFEALEAYKWDEDPQFQVNEPLRAILPSPR